MKQTAWLIAGMIAFFLASVAKNEKIYYSETLNFYNMKNKTGTISGFVLGVTSFLLMFKLIFLDNIPPADELAPGIVVIASVLNGLLFAFIGSVVQNYFVKKRNYK